MPFEEEFVTRLLSVTAITDLVSENIHWVALPEGASRNGLVLNVAVAGNDYSHDGRVDLQYPRVQIDSYGEAYGEAKVLSRAVLTEVEKVHEGATILFEDGICLRDQDMDKETLEGGTEIFRVSQEFLVPFRSK